MSRSLSASLTRFEEPAVKEHGKLSGSVRAETDGSVATDTVDRWAGTSTMTRGSLSTKSSTTASLCVDICAKESWKAF